MAGAFASIPMTSVRGSAPRQSQDRPPVARAQVDDDPVESGDLLSGLADVHLCEATSRHCSHPQNLHFLDERG